MKKRIEFYLFQLFKRLVLALPLKSAQRLGSYLGMLAYYLVVPRRRIALENLRHAFPEKPEQELTQIVKGAFRNFAISFVELLWFPNLTDDGIRNLVRMRNPELMVEAFKKGRGMVMLTGHFGNWELIALAVAHITGIPVTIIVQPQSNELVDGVINRHRCLFGNKVVPMGLAVREIIRTLQDGGVIALAPDQSGPMEGPFVEFFGRLVSAHQGPAVFALRSGAPMQMGFMLRQQDGTYEVVLEEISTAGITDYTEENTVELTRCYTALLEKYIRQRPDHWLWLHRRWKHTWERVQQEKASQKSVQSSDSPRRILIVQTAFLGDVVLTLPLVQVAQREFPEAKIDFLATPRTLGVLRNHPAIDLVIAFDKQGRDSGFAGLMQTAKTLRNRGYDVALVPHRSIRSALLVWLARIPVRIGFHNSTGRFLFTRRAKYQKSLHEIERNVSLLQALGVSRKDEELPTLFPSRRNILVVDMFLQTLTLKDMSRIIAIAPGTVWNTKRWLKERYAELARRLVDQGFTIMLFGGKEDEKLCEEIQHAVSRPDKIASAAGKLSLLESAELLRRCKILICNDSAPMHLAVAMRTPVVAIFGATVPEFGFAPRGKHDVVMETRGLQCRPCTVHGGDECPIKTFVCMRDITSAQVYEQTLYVLGSAGTKLK